jgi:hypothetical protein
MDAEELYYKLRAFAEEHGFVGDHADSLLGDAAQSIADDPRNNEEDE